MTEDLRVSVDVPSSQTLSRPARVIMASARLAGGVSTLLHCCAASTLTLAQLRREIPGAWQEFAAQSEEIETGLSPWEEDMVERLVPANASVLVIGCGSGRDVLPLLARGCRVVGVDPADRAVDRARAITARRGLTADYITGFFEDVPLSGTFDAVLFSYFSYTLIPTVARRRAALNKAMAHLAPGGRIVVSYQPMLLPRTYMLGVTRLVGWLFRSDWRIEPGDYLARVRFGGRDAYRYVHAFAAGEVAREASAVGLRVTSERAWSDEVVLALER